MSFGIANFFCMFSNMAVFFFLPMYVITAMGCSAVEAGLTTTLYSVAGLFLSPIFGRMIGKAGNARGVLSFGCIMRILVAGALLAFVAPGLPTISVIYVIMLVAGCYNSVQDSAFSAGPADPVPPCRHPRAGQLAHPGGAKPRRIHRHGPSKHGHLEGTMGVVGGMPVALTVSIVTAAAALACSPCA